ncbi:hypothetical protein F3Y22_tig00116991pilonHSYRG00003 [Hibiscus syriacus]|uniref:Protein kinase domain-containing protein n=1 Tax=Hibiscus syriacus TaxID=106335 RepID=A0A6A2WSE0_HIBSY|nr:hypothetical protein F3Y22_tig00116991pilonHSYRG00003 [Hibiscus syriacus]
MQVSVGNGCGAIENTGSSTANMLTGSIGYIAPEYDFGSNTSFRGDVFSFGVIVLEMVKNHYHGRVEKVVDSLLIRASLEQSPEVKRMWEIAIAELIELGILCMQKTPSTRPTMLDAANDLDRHTTVTFASSLGISSYIGDN